MEGERDRKGEREREREKKERGREAREKTGDFVCWLRCSGPCVEIGRAHV